jgi:DNA polymerase
LWKEELIKLYNSRLELLNREGVGKVDPALVYDRHLEEKVERPIMVVGEAPGEEEARRGEPFVGKAGENLNYLISLTGLDRNRHFLITNIFPFRPIDPSGKNRPPTAKELKLALPYWKEELELVNPPLVLLLGNSAIRGVSYLYPELKSLPKCGYYRLAGRRWGVCYHPSPLAFYRPKIREGLEQFFRELPRQLREIGQAWNLEKRG